MRPHACLRTLTRYACALDVNRTHRDTLSPPRPPRIVVGREARRGRPESSSTERFPSRPPVRLLQLEKYRICSPYTPFARENSVDRRNRDLDIEKRRKPRRSAWLLTDSTEKGKHDLMERKFVRFAANDGTERPRCPRRRKKRRGRETVGNNPWRDTLARRAQWTSRRIYGGYRAVRFFLSEVELTRAILIT